MDTPENTDQTGELLRVDPPPTCSPLVDLLDAFKSLARLNDAAKMMDEKAWKLIESLTNDPREYPKAVKIGTIETDVATIRIDGVTSEPIEIMTGADGGFDVYADSYDDYGLPGRIIIELHRPILQENAKGDGSPSQDSNEAPR